jgi:hypothetical protein
LYGLPTMDAVDASEREELVLGGCLVPESPPAWSCNACGHRWGELEAPEPVTGTPWDDLDD